MQIRLLGTFWKGVAEGWRSVVSCGGLEIRGRIIGKPVERGLAEDWYYIGRDVLLGVAKANRTYGKESS